MIELNSDIHDRFASLVLSYFGISIDKYLASNNARSLFGYTINLEKRVFMPIFGNPPCSLTDKMNGRFVDSIAGYKVDIRNAFPAENVNADALLLSTELSSASDPDFNSILLHEACHLIIDGKLSNNIELPITEKDRYYGDRLFKKTDYKNEFITRHTINFCILLAAAAQRYSKISEDFTDRWAVINSAMRYDLKNNVRN